MVYDPLLLATNRVLMNNKMAVNQANIWAGLCMPVLEDKLREELFITCILVSDKKEGESLNK